MVTDAADESLVAEPDQVELEKSAAIPLNVFQLFHLLLHVLFVLAPDRTTLSKLLRRCLIVPNFFDLQLTCREHLGQDKVVGSMVLENENQRCGDGLKSPKETAAVREQV